MNVDGRRVCSNCGATNSGPQQACLICGKPLAVVALAPPAPALVYCRNLACGSRIPVGRIECPACGARVKTPLEEAGLMFCSYEGCVIPFPRTNDYCPTCGKPVREMTPSP